MDLQLGLVDQGVSVVPMDQDLEDNLLKHPRDHLVQVALLDLVVQQMVLLDQEASVLQLTRLQSKRCLMKTVL